MKRRTLDRINRIVRITAFVLLLIGGLVAAMSTPGTSRSMTSERVELRHDTAKAWTLELGKTLRADESIALSES